MVFCEITVWFLWKEASVWWARWDIMFVIGAWERSEWSICCSDQLRMKAKGWADTVTKLVTVGNQDVMKDEIGSPW